MGITLALASVGAVCGVASLLVVLSIRQTFRQATHKANPAVWALIALAAGSVITSLANVYRATRKPDAKE
jgi:hypothetical protein